MSKICFVFLLVLSSMTVANEKALEPSKEIECYEGLDCYGPFRAYHLYKDTTETTVVFFLVLKSYGGEVVNYRTGKKTLFSRKKAEIEYKQIQLSYKKQKAEKKSVEG